MARGVRTRRQGTPPPRAGRSSPAVPHLARPSQAHAGDRRAHRHDARHGRRRRAAFRARGAAQGRGRGRARLLYQPRVAQGTGGARPPRRRAALLVGAARVAGPLRRTRRARQRRGSRRLFRDPRPRQPARRLGLLPEQPARLARGPHRPARRGHREVRGDAGAAPAALVWPAGEAAFGGVLEEPSRPAARARAVHAGEAGRALGGAAAQPVNARLRQKSGIWPGGAAAGSSGSFARSTGTSKTAVTGAWSLVPNSRWLSVETAFSASSAPAST